MFIEMARNETPLLLGLVTILLVLVGFSVIYFTLDFSDKKVDSQQLVLKDKDEGLSYVGRVISENVPEDYVNFAKGGSSSDNDDNDDDEYECVVNSDCDDGEVCINHECEDENLMECVVNSDCDDGDLLTDDSCVAGFCHNDFNGECRENDDCSDGNVLTRDRCVAGQCSFSLIGNCDFNWECADGNALTNDVCTNNVCQNNFIGNCLNDLNCDDGDASTSDVCVDYFCEHTFSLGCRTNSECNDSNICTNDVCNLADFTCSNNVVADRDTYSPLYPGTEGVGICQSQIETCNAVSQNWIVLQNEVNPQLEGSPASCNDGIDNDCDAGIDVTDSGCVDLEIVEIDRLVTGGNFYYFDIKNNGYVDLNNILWSLSMGNGAIFNNNLEPISLGRGEDIRIRKFYVYPVSGSYTAFAYADYLNNFDESNESNNGKTLGVVI